MKDKIVKEWFTRAEHDFDTAKLVFDQEGHYEEAVFLLQQALEKYLKGYLIYNGWELKKIHDLETLLTEAMEYDKAFEKFLDLGRRLTAFYYENRYPPGPIIDISKEDTISAFEAIEAVISKIKAKASIKS